MSDAINMPVKTSTSENSTPPPELSGATQHASNSPTSQLTSIGAIITRPSFFKETAALM